MLKLKDLGGKTRIIQDKQIAFIQKLGFEVIVIDNEEKLENFIKNLKEEIDRK